MSTNRTMRAPLTVAEKERVIRLYKAGRTQAYIAEQLRCHPRTVANVIARAGLKRRGNYGGWHRYSPETQRTVIDAYKGGESKTSIVASSSIPFVLVSRWIDEAGVTRSQSENISLGQARRRASLSPLPPPERERRGVILGPARDVRRRLADQRAVRSATAPAGTATTLVE